MLLHAGQADTFHDTYENLTGELQKRKYSNVFQHPFCCVHTYGSFSVLFCSLTKIKLTHPLLACFLIFISSHMYISQKKIKTGESFQKEKKKWLKSYMKVGILDQAEKGSWSCNGISNGTGAGEHLTLTDSSGLRNLPVHSRLCCMSALVCV